MIKIFIAFNLSVEFLSSSNISDIYVILSLQLRKLSFPSFVFLFVFFLYLYRSIIGNTIRHFYSLLYNYFYGFIYRDTARWRVSRS